MTNSYVPEIFKFTGAGNNFVVIDGRKGGVDAFRQPRRITKLCREYQTDGLMILGDAESLDFSMEFFNPDGSGGMMCGNGGRCIVAFADYLGLKPASPDGTWHFLAPDGVHEAMILDCPQEGIASGGHVHPRTWVGGGARCDSSGRGRSERSERSSSGGNFPLWTVRLKMIDVVGVTPVKDGYFLNTGTRHYVQFVKDVDSIDMEAEAKPIRWDAAFQPEGTNVNFVQVTPEGLKVRTFEKGVEGETLACGTGITASAIAACYAQIPNLVGDDGKIHLQCRRGDWLQVEFKKDGSSYKDVYLTGPAEIC